MHSSLGDARRQLRRAEAHDVTRRLKSAIGASVEGDGRVERQMRHQLERHVTTILAKLHSSDTRQQALEQLAFVLRALPVQQIPVILNELRASINTAGSGCASALRPSARKAYAQLYGIIAQAHGAACAPFVNTMTTQLAHRSDDSDSAVRAAVADSFAALMVHTVLPVTKRNFKKRVTQESSEIGEQFPVVSPFARVLRVLVTRFERSHRNARLGAAICLTAVVSNCDTRILAPALPRLMPQLLRLLAPRRDIAGGKVDARAEMVTLLAAVVSVASVATAPWLSAMVCVALDASVDKQWQCRRAACHLLQTIPHSLCPQSPSFRTDEKLLKKLSRVRAEVLTALEKRRFDRITHVRVVAVEAQRCWNELVDAEVQDNFRDVPSETDSSRSVSAVPTNREAAKRALQSTEAVHVSRPKTSPTEPERPKTSPTKPERHELTTDVSETDGTVTDSLFSDRAQTAPHDSFKNNSPATSIETEQREESKTPTSRRGVPSRDEVDAWKEELRESLKRELRSELKSELLQELRRAETATTQWKHALSSLSKQVAQLQTGLSRSRELGERRIDRVLADMEGIRLKLEQEVLRARQAPVQSLAVDELNRSEVRSTSRCRDTFDVREENAWEVAADAEAKAVLQQTAADTQRKQQQTEASSYDTDTSLLDSFNASDGDKKMALVEFLQKRPKRLLLLPKSRLVQVVTEICTQVKNDGCEMCFIEALEEVTRRFDLPAQVLEMIKDTLHLAAGAPCRAGQRAAEVFRALTTAT